MTISFSVLGDPKPQGSLRHVGRGRLIYSNTLIEWRKTVIKTVELFAETLDVIDYPVYLRVDVFVPRPKAARNRAFPTKRSSGDLDKHIRTIGDCLVLGGLLTDDSLIIDIRASKRYSETPGVAITIREVTS